MINLTILIFIVLTGCQDSQLIDLEVSSLS